MMTKVAMITGGAQGIGAEIARHLSKNGFDIAIGDLPQQKEKAQAVITEVASAGQKAVFIPVDVTDQAGVAKAVDEAADQLGGFDVMVNNAGVAKVDKFEDIKPNDLEFSFKINVFGVIYGTQAAAKKFKELGVAGKIINASSIAGMRAFPVWATYSATKAAVISLTQAAANEFAPDHITVNAYAPGVVGTTGMWDAIDKKMSEINGKPLGQNKKDFIGTIPLGRTVEPNDIANIVQFLASPAADFITGQAYAVDGGGLL
ncbi:acetoin reductase [Lentilactobacillus parafarraginis F0439]|jgi:meso-butanediol dehydrogenase/(S,S)-butanediol dehydrogenase/diacetyl reductase|uniref:diacetyl reductase [(S)-acetoin forming] n=3 Tax=Lentilactobacillus parafarraginis TaxID=390842 RepID=A0A0R1YR45_9LACO|nr:acetoin reductase [Lentilactobacillus parafarraginis F0439]KRM43332.1 acetoin reductase [Lentilactobacillus parafarraginis DSM 18390 = JCM 14109]